MQISSKLEEEFNLAPFQEDSVEETDIEIVKPVTIEQCDELVDKINAALPKVDGLHSTDKEFDELAEYAITAHKDLLELSMNVEQRFIGEIASVSGNMLAHAITAKTNKIKANLDKVALQIRKQIADSKIKSNSDEEDSGGKVMDRNEMMAELLKMPKN